MNKKGMSAQDAFLDFLSRHEQSLKPLPPELRVAKQTAAGRVKMKGAAVALGWQRVQRLLETYAPGEYRVADPEFFRVSS